IAVYLFDHLGDILHSIPYFWVAVMQVEFIANTPSEQCRMIFVFHDFFPQSGELLGYSFGIIIIKSMSFCGYRQTHGDGQTTYLRFIQDLLSIMRTPSTY